MAPKIITYAGVAWLRTRKSFYVNLNDSAIGDSVEGRPVWFPVRDEMVPYAVTAMLDDREFKIDNNDNSGDGFSIYPRFDIKNNHQQFFTPATS